MKKNDILLAGSVLFLAALLMIFFYFQGNVSGNCITVTIDGELYGTFALSDNQEIAIDTQYGHNLLVIESGKVYMKEADCPDGYCKRQGKITGERETIVCLPHKLVVEIETDDGLPAKQLQENDIIVK